MWSQPDTAWDDRAPIGPTDPREQGTSSSLRRADTAVLVALAACLPIALVDLPLELPLIALLVAAVVTLRGTVDVLAVAESGRPRSEVAAVVIVVSGGVLLAVLVGVSAAVPGLRAGGLTTLVALTPAWVALAGVTATILVTRLAQRAEPAASRSIVWGLLTATLAFDIGISLALGNQPSAFTRAAFVLCLLVPALPGVEAAPELLRRSSTVSIEEFRAVWGSAVLIPAGLAVLTLVLHNQGTVGVVPAAIAVAVLPLCAGLVALAARCHAVTAARLRVEAREREARDQALADARTEVESAVQTQRHFLSRTSHELRTPLHAILGFAELATEATDSAGQPYIDEITHAGQRLRSLVDELLDLRDIELGNLEYHIDHVDVRAVLDKVVERLADTDRSLPRRVRTDIADQQTVCADPDRLAQALRNLVSNAAIYTDGVIVVSLTAHGRSATLAVSDEGPGLSHDELEDVFNPFTRLEPEEGGRPGFGLGLPIARALCEGMGGSLTAAADLGRGSTFTIELPCVTDLRVVGRPMAA